MSPRRPPTSMSLFDEPKIWSKYQSSIFEAVEQGKRNIAVVARAGTGKTTIITESSFRIKRGLKILVVAFNRITAAELKERVHPSCDVMTLNGLGHRCIQSAFGAKKPESEKWLRAILRGPKFFPNKGHASERTAIAEIVSRAKNTLALKGPAISPLIDRLRIDPLILLDDHERGGNTTPEEIERDGRRRIIMRVQEVFATCKQEAPTSPIIDYDDQLWLPHVLTLSPGQWDWVIVDEAQDLNMAQIDLLKKAVKPGGRFMAVGDPMQAIYGFRGAESRSFDMLIEMFDAHVMSLPVTYRCGKKIVEEAQKFVFDFEAGPNNCEGEVRTIKRLEPGELDVGDFVISRTNAPLLSLCFRAISAGLPAVLVGRDIGRSLARLVTDAQEDLGGESEDVKILGRVLSTLDRQIKIRVEGDDDATDLIDKKQCIAALYEAKRTTANVLDSLSLLFVDDEGLKGKVTFGTAHRLKGKEATRAFILESTFNPNRGGEETNLFYVAITRAKEELIYVESEK